MLDPVPPPPPLLLNAVRPLANALYLPTLAYHIHEVLGAFFLYQITQSYISPAVSQWLFPNIYPKLTKRTRVNWDVHVVSLVQSLLINGLALWVMYVDEERQAMNSVERIYGYTGASGLIQGLATGYFLWDLVVSVRYFKIFGVGILAHAITASLVFSFGFRPFANYYGPVFILYELSSPFLNVHWFCDKLNMTGSKLQWWNGMILLATFFGCRLAWGTYNSLRVYQDVWQILHLKGGVLNYRELHNITNSAHSIFVPQDGQLCQGATECLMAQAEVMKFAGQDTRSVPVWLCGIYLTCNVVLNSLNWYWFGKMIETVRKRFTGEPHDEFKRERDRKPSIVEEVATELDYNSLSGPKTPSYERGESSAMGIIDEDSQATLRKRG